MIQSYASNKEDSSSQVPTYASYPYDGRILEYYQEKNKKNEKKWQH